jgi:hypothetical protein
VITSHQKLKHTAHEIGYESRYRTTNHNESIVPVERDHIMCSLPPAGLQLRQRATVNVADGPPWVLLTLDIVTPSGLADHR